MKRLVLPILAAACFGFTGCEVEKEFDTKEYSFDVTVPIVANGAGTVEGLSVEDMNLNEEVSSLSGGKAGIEEVQWIRVKEARIEALDADQENNMANFSSATVQISKEYGNSPVSASRDIPDEYNSRVNFDNAFGEQNLKPALTDDFGTEYRVRFNARRATTKELHAQLKIRFVFQVKYKAYF